MIGDNVRRLREEKGWSQARLARMIGKAPSTITMIEAGDRLPSWAVANALAAVLDVSLDTLNQQQSEQVQA